VRAMRVMSALTIMVLMTVGASPSFGMELDLPRVMLKGIEYSLTLSEPSAVDPKVTNDLVLQVDGVSIPLTWLEDAPGFHGVVIENDQAQLKLIKEGRVQFETSLTAIPAWVSILPPLVAILSRS